jgi:hypothetical protein
MSAIGHPMPLACAQESIEMIHRTRHSQRLVALFLFGALLFGYPLLALFDVGGVVAGIPLLYAYLFGAWAVLIALMAWVVERGG